MDPDDFALDFMDVDDELEFDAYGLDEDFEDEIDEELDGVLDELLMEASDGDEEDLDERRRRRRRGRRRGRKGRKVRTARGKSLYRAPTPKSFVTQKQFKAALGRVSGETKRNALGIKSVNTKLARLDNRVDGVVTVNKIQTRRLQKLDQQTKIDAALAFVEGFSIDGSTNEVSVNAYALYRAALKGGMLGEAKGALGNPLVLGGIGAILRPELGFLNRTVL